LYRDKEKSLMDVSFEKLLEGRLHVYVSKHSPLALADAVTPEDLINETVVLFNGETLKYFFDDFLANYGPMNLLFTSNNTEVIKKYVTKRLAISFFFDIPPKRNNKTDNNEIISIPLVNYEPVHIFYGVIRSKKKGYSLEAEEFLNYLQLHIEERK